MTIEEVRDTAVAGLEDAKAQEQRQDEGAIGEVYERCCLDPEAEPFYSPVIQERAWTSPIWINPS